MNLFAVRLVIELAARSIQTKKHLYEERITLWRADTFEGALKKAEIEARSYAKEEQSVLSLAQAYELYDPVSFEGESAEVFSLVRESDLAQEEYLTAFFDTGNERTQSRKPNQSVESTPPSRGGSP